jgi:hypothetical protein
MQIWKKIVAAFSAMSNAIINVITCMMSILAFLWILSFDLSSAQDLPDKKSVQSETSAEEIVTQYLEVIGGADVIRAVVSKRITYWVHTFGSDPYLMESFWTRPNSKRTGRPGESTYTLTEGKKSWRVNSEGRRELSAGVASSLSKMADIDGPLVDPIKKGVTFSYSGIVRYDMTDLHQVTVTFADGIMWEFFFDTNTGLLRKLTRPSFFMLNNQISRGPDVHFYYYDYRAVESVLYPQLWIQSTDDHTHLFVVENIQIQN